MSEPEWFYTRAHLRVRRPDTERRSATREYLIHQLVGDLFPDQENRGHLYRVTLDRPGGAEVLVLSSLRPRQPEGQPVRDWGCTINVETKPFKLKLTEGQLVDYEVRINATTSVDGKRTDVWEAVFAKDRDDPRSPEEVYQAFLIRRLTGAAEVLSTHLIERGFLRIRRGLNGGRPITFVSTNLIGTLRVVDASSLVKILTRGVGRAKAFGHGLICLSAPGTVHFRAERRAS